MSSNGPRTYQRTVTQPSNLPATEKKPGIDSESVDIANAVETGTAETTTMRGEALGTKGAIEIDTTRVTTDQLDHEHFMRDEVEILVQESQNENDPGFVEVNVNGDYKLIHRGHPCVVRRYHVAALARAKQSRVKQDKIVNPDGSMGFREVNVIGLTYPFQVMHDPRPSKGGPWLRALLQTPA